MTKRLIILFLFFKPLIILAQQNSLVYQIRFDRNKFEITDKNKQILSLICDTLNGKANYIIYINGYTDSDADSSYNQQLSMKRSLAAKEYLIENGIEEALIKVQALGEEQPLVANTTPLQKAKNRRVELFVLFQQKAAEKTIEKAEKQNLPNDSGDTTVALENGYKLTLSKSDYEKNRQCLKVKKGVSYKFYIKENWLKKHIGFKNYKKVISYEPHYKFSVIACTDSCFKNSVKLFIPQYDAIGLKIGARYSQRKNNKNSSTTLTFSKTKMGDSAYYKTEIYCPGTINCGTDNRCTHPVKLIAKNNISILSYSYYARSHTSYFDSLIEVNPSNNKKITEIYTHMFFHRLNIICNGDTISFENIPIDVFAHGWKKIKTLGGEDDISYFMFIPFRKKYWCGHYRKYKIRQKDIENLRHFNFRELQIENRLD